MTAAAVHPLAGPIRAHVVRLAKAQGRAFRKVRLATERGPAGDCWTNAWDLGIGYAEGVVLMPDGTTHLHAWAVDADGTAVELTAGYENATRYRGFLFDRAKPLPLESEGWSRPRSSMLEAGVGAGIPWEAIRREALR